MLAALVLASFLAQAEQAPPEPPPPAPAAPAPAPATAETAPSRPENALSLLGQLAARPGDAGRRLGPDLGFSLGGSFEHRWPLQLGGLDLGLAADFFYTRFAMAVVAPDAQDPTRTLTKTSFAVLQTAAVPLGAVRIFAGLGGGVLVAYFSTPERDLQPGSMSAVQPLARGVLGVDVALSPTMALTFRGSYTLTFTRPTFTTETGQSYSLMGDLIDVGAGIRLGF